MLSSNDFDTFHHFLKYFEKGLFSLSRSDGLDVQEVEVFVLLEP